MVSYTLEGSTAVIQMDDGKADALSVPMIDALIAALARAEKEAAAIVLTGRAERFCAGFDMRVMMSGREAAVGLLRHGLDLLLGFYGTPLPVVIACTGHALAGGALLVMTGDLRLGVEGAFKIGLNELAIGIPLPLLGMEFARDRLSPAELTRATLLANIYAPDEAARAGFLDHVIPAAQLAARAREEAARLGALNRAAFSSTKKLLRQATIERIRTQLEADMARLIT